MFEGKSNDGKPFQDTVIAEVSPVVRAVFAIFFALLILSAILVSSLAATALILGFSAFVLMVYWRVRAMRLAVSTGGVQVVNFASEHTFDLDRVQLETEEEASQWPADDLPAAMKTPAGEDPTIGSLYLSDGADTRVKVGVVPSYGPRRLSIIEDLKIALAQHRI